MNITNYLSSATWPYREDISPDARKKASANPSPHVASPQSPDLLQNLIARLEGGSRAAWGIGRRSADGRYYIRYQRRCIPLVHLRLDLRNVLDGTRLTRTENDLDFQIVLYQDEDAGKASAGLYRIDPEFQPLLTTDSGPFEGYVFAVGALGKSSDAVAYGLFAVFSRDSGSVLGDSSPELLGSWDAIAQLLEGCSNGMG